MANILVTGSAGFIGSHLCVALLREGHQVWGLDDLSSGSVSNNTAVLDETGEDVLLTVGSVTDVLTCYQMTREMDCIYHLAARASVPWCERHPVEARLVNRVGTMLLLGHYDDRHKSVVFASTCAVEAGASAYANSKRAAESYVRGFGGVSLRLFNVFGPWQKATPGAEGAVVPAFIRALLTGEEITIHGDGHQTRDLVYVEDVVSAFRLAATVQFLPPEPLQVGTGHSVSVLELLDLLQEITGERARVRHVEPRAGDLRESVATGMEQTKQALGWAPQGTLRDGLAATVAWWREELRL